MAVVSEELANSDIGEAVEEVVSEDIVVKERKVKFNETVVTEPPPNLISISFSHNRTNDHFQQWLNKQKERDKIAAREKYIARRLGQIDDEEKQQRKERGRATFEIWKQNKDLKALELNNLKSEIERINSLLKKETKKAETLPGYISTWSGDTPLVKKMQKQCPRNRDV